MSLRGGQARRSAFGVSIIPRYIAYQACLSPPGLPDAHWRVVLAFLSFSARMPVAPGGEDPDENLELFLSAQRQFLCETDRSLKLALLHCASGVRHFHLTKPILRQAFCDAASALLGLSWKAPTTAAAVFNRKLNDLLLWGSRCAPSVAWLRLHPEALSS